MAEDKATGWSKTDIESVISATAFGGIMSDITNMKGDIDELKEDVKEVKNEVTEIKIGIVGLTELVKAQTKVVEVYEGKMNNNLNSMREEQNLNVEKGRLKETKKSNKLNKILVAVTVLSAFSAVSSLILWILFVRGIF